MGWVGGRIEKRLKRTFHRMGSVVDVQMYSCSIGEFEVHVSNNCWLVVNLSVMTCTYKRWQRWGLSCTLVITVIYKKNLHVYTYVYSCYKVQT